MNIKKITLIALLTTIALIIFSVEGQLPPIVPIPGIKLGLANIVTVYAMFTLGSYPTLMILICRIFLGSILSGQIFSIVYSLSGGILCYFSMLIMRRLITKQQLWVCSAVAAIFHNLGQIAVAAVVMGTPGVIVYLPLLMISGIASGIFTGLCAQFLVYKLPL